jgi:hypothetical protein
LTVPCGRRRRHALLAAAIVAAGALLAGCGGGDESTRAASATTSTTEQAATPPPVQPLSEQVAAFERAVKDPSCAAAIDLVHPVLLPDPEHPESKANCGDATYPLRAERGVEVVDSAELGTGAVVDTRLDGNRESLIWALDPSGRYKWTGAFIGSDQVGTSPVTTAVFDRVAAEFVKGLRDEDCDAVYALLESGSRLGYGSRDTFCSKFADTYVATPEGLGSRLQADPEAEPQLLGATEDLAFYGIATRPSGYRTLVLGIHRSDQDPIVIDVLPAER